MKKIIIGIDVSKEKCDATAILTENGLMEVKKLDYIVFENRANGFRSLLSWSRKLMPEATDEELLFVCETTGAYDRAMCDYLFGKGMDVWRESALQINRCGGVRRGKDDRTDSLMIAEYAMRHLDKAVYYESPDKTVRELKALLLYRHKLTQEKTAKKVRMNQMKSTAARSHSMTFILRDSARGVRTLEKSIRECDRQIRELIKSEEALKRNYHHLTSIRGINIVNATAMIVYSNNFRNIKDANKMATYYGVASFRTKSGTSVDKRAEVGQYSNSTLRMYITQAASCAISENGIYREYFLRKTAEGKAYGIVINNVKNKLIHLAFSLVKNDMDYEQNHELMRVQNEKNVKSSHN